MGKYDNNRYEEFGYFFTKVSWCEGYKIMRYADDWVSDMTYKDTESAQKFIDDMIEMMDNSKVDWNESIHNQIVT